MQNIAKIKIIHLSHGLQTDPKYATNFSAGLDLQAAIKDELVLNPQQRILIPTGISIALPEFYEAQIRPRSGLAIKHGVTVLNSPGTIDCDYRGEIQIILINLANENFVITRGMRIAQMIIAPYTKAQFQLVNSFIESDNKRNSGGFGSTGY